MLKVQVIGNLGADAQIKNINGVEYVSFDVAHSYKENGKDVTVWVGCLAKGHKNVVPYLLKGKKVYVVGDLSCRLYDSSAYHCKMIGYNCFVDTLQLCSPKDNDEKKEVSAGSMEPTEDDNKPF